MRVTDFNLKNFRNYSEAKIQFSGEVNFITGKNGSGKTNILEALSILSNIRSFRNIGDASIIKKDESSYFCSAILSDSRYTKFETGCTLSNGKILKRIKIDGSEIHKVKDYYGKFLTVIFSPTDINLINGSPEIRRRFIDSVISKTDAEYLETLSEFKKILLSRNILLKKIRNNSLSDLKSLEVWDTVFAEKAYKITKKRDDYIKEFSSKFSNSYRLISDSDAQPDLTYNSYLEKRSAEDIFSLTVKNRNKDIKSGTTTSGPQKDDYLITINDKDLFNNFASQGQKRTASIAIKIAEFETVENKTGDKCVILVDDIFSELDLSRRENMVKVLSRGNQVIFTMVNADNISRDYYGESSRFFICSEGRITEK